MAILATYVDTGILALKQGLQSVSQLAIFCEYETVETFRHLKLLPVLGVGYDRNGVLRTGTGNWIFPNTIPVLVNGTGIYFLTFRFLSIRNWNFKSLFPKIYFIQQVFIKVRYAF